MYWISQAGVSIWLSSYWISVAGVEEAESILCTAWPHKHPDETGLNIRIAIVQKV